MREKKPFDHIAPIDTSSLADKVESNIVSLLANRQLKVGDTIPKELELSQTLGVSRTVVREVLTRLRSAGIVETKKKGTVITSPDIFGILNKSLNPYILDTATLRDIFEMRLIQEVGMADFIFEHITPDDVKDLRKIVKKDASESKSHLFNIEHEIEFHGKLYEITGNQTLMKFQKLLLPIFNYVNSSGLLSKPNNNKVYVSHKGLVDILEKGTPEQFRNAMRLHLSNHFDRILAEPKS